MSANRSNRLILMTTINDDLFEIVVSTKIDDRAPSVESKKVSGAEVVAAINGYAGRRYVIETRISLDGGPALYPTDFIHAFRMIRQSEWVTSDEFYADAAETGRYGGETDFGCFWRITGRDMRDGFNQYERARVSWIENTGEIYAYVSGRYLLLGRTRAHDREYVETVLDDWADACMAASSLSWIRRAIGVMARSYRDDRDAAKAFGEPHGYAGAQGGWIYLNNAEKPVAQGWWSAVGRYLESYGGMVKDEQTGRYRIVDRRALHVQRANTGRLRVV